MRMAFSIFDSVQNTHKVNINIFNLRNRSNILEIEANLLVLRLLQLRDCHNANIVSVKQDNRELPNHLFLKDLDLSEISVEEVAELTSAIGYTFSPHNSKVNIEINGKN